MGEKTNSKEYQEIIIKLKDNASLAKRIAEEAYALVLLLEDYGKEEVSKNGNSKKRT